MDDGNIATIRELHWEDVRDDIKRVNPALYNIIEKISPGKEYTLFKTRLPYGTESVVRGRFLVPNNTGRLVPLTDPEIDPKTQEKLGYNINTNPACLVLSKAMEIYLPMDNYTISYGMMRPGNIFSTSRILSHGVPHQPSFLWNVSSGARSIFMLPKISKIVGYKRLRRELQLHCEKPKSWVDHWRIFKELSEGNAFGEDWHVDVLYFTKPWFDKLQDPEWKEFHHYLLDTTFASFGYWHVKFVWDLIFSYIQKTKGIKPPTYINDVVRHLLEIGIGVAPGFSPALDDNFAPVKRLQEIFTDVYQLEKYSPIIMQPGIFSLYEACQPVYYSLRYPNLDLTPKSREDASTIAELYEVKLLLDKYLREILSGNLHINDTPIYDLTKRVQFDFFHANSEDYSGIHNGSLIPREDEAFLKAGHMECRDFPVNSPFVRGCIRLSHKQST